MLPIVPADVDVPSSAPRTPPSASARRRAYDAREQLLYAANRALLADRLDHSGAHDAAEQEYADDMLILAARAYAALTQDVDVPEARPAAAALTATSTIELEPSDPPLPQQAGPDRPAGR